MNNPDNLKQSSGLDREKLRKAMDVASYIKDLPFKILPGHAWLPHYPDNTKREQMLEQVLKGEITPEQVDLNLLKPDGFTYDVSDIDELGLSGLIGKARDTSTFYDRFNYSEFTQFLYGLKDKNADLATATQLFSSIAKSRIQSELMRSLGATGRQQVKKALENEAANLVKESADRTRMQKIFDVLKMRWLEKQGIVKKQDRQKTEKEAEQEIIDIADALEKSYIDYVKTGEVKSRQKLVESMKESFEEIQRQQEEDKLDDFIEDALNNPEKLPPEQRQELEQMFDDYVPPQGDIPSGVQDGLSPSMDPMKKGAEKSEIVPLYTIEPALKTYYQGQIYSRFNTREVRWENTAKYKKINSGDASRDHVIRGKCTPGSMVPVFLPRYYSLSNFSVPSGIEIHQDDKGCFYLKNNTSSVYEFELGFGKKANPDKTQPTPDENADISSGSLSQATLSYLAGLRGKSNVEKAQAVVHYMKNILKLEYSNDSKYNLIYKRNPSKYFTEIEAHKQVDCDVAQTYFIALCRAIGVPSRIVTGHSVDMVKDGKAIIHSGTGHAWTEIWDEQNKQWKTIDSTPEKHEEEGGEPSEGGEKKKKTDIDAPEQEPRDEDQAPSPDEVKKKVEDQLEKTKSSDKEEKTKASDVSEKTREKMKGMKEKQEGQKGQKGESEGEGEGEGEESSESSESESSQGGKASEAGTEKGEEGQPVSDQEWEKANREMQDIDSKSAERAKKAQEMRDKIQEAKNFKDMADAEKQLNEADLEEQARKKLEAELKAKEEKAKQDLKDKIEKMKNDGFLTEEQTKEMLKQLEENPDLSNFQNIENQITRESALYNEYESIRKEIMPLVEKWFRFFAERLPKIEEPEFSEDTGRRGRFDRRTINKPRNLIFGITQNPLVIRSQIQPKFMAQLILDISGSMSGKMRDARKLLIFFAELFERISQEYGYIEFGVSAFDTAVELIKDFDYEYSSPKRYDFGSAGKKTVKLRLMEMTMARGGTDMGQAVFQGNKRLNEAKKKHPDFLSSMYVISDGETSGDLTGEKLKRFVGGLESYAGEWWGHHMKCGFLLGPESQKQVLAQYFGDKNSESVPEIDKLIAKVMMRFDKEIQGFIDRLPKD